MKTRGLLTVGAIVVTALSTPAVAENVERSPVKVERVKPKQPKKPTLRFLKQNVDFLRGQLDWLNQVPRHSGNDAAAMNERWLRYRELMAAAVSSRDSVETARLAEGRVEFLERVADLADLEARLDLMDQLLVDQEERLAWLDADFTGRQETALIVLVDAFPGTEHPRAIRFVEEDGDARTVEVSPEHLEVLANGGVVQLLHDFVEPREQVWEVTVLCVNEATAGPFYVTFRPQRNRLSFLELDLHAIASEREADPLAASLWVHGERVDTDDWRWASR